MMDTTKELSRESVYNFSDQLSIQGLGPSHLSIMKFRPENNSLNDKSVNAHSKAKDTELSNQEFELSSRFLEGFSQLMKAELAEQKKVVEDSYQAELDKQLETAEQKQREVEGLYQSQINTYKSKISHLEELVTSATSKANKERQKRIQSEEVAQQAFDEFANNAKKQSQLLRQYEADNNKLAQKIELLNELNKDLLREINVSNIKLEDSEELSQSLRSENSTQRDEIAELTFELVSARTELEEQQSQIESLTTTLTGFEEEATRLVSVETEYKAEIAKLSESNSKLSRKKDSLNTAVANARTEINSLNEDLDAAKLRYLSLKDTNIELEKENKILKLSSKEPIELRGKDRLPADSIKELKARLSAALDKVNKTNASRLELLIKVKEQADTIELLTNKGSLLAS